MHQFDYDILFVGGGLVNSLLAWRLKQTQPHLRFLILEQGNSLGGKHTWSFHEGDLSPTALDWISPLISASWPFYQVAFPEYSRQIESRYYTIRSKKFHDVLFRDLFQEVRFGAEVVAVSKNQVVLKDGTLFSSNWIFDGRGIPLLENGTCGFQKFLGLEVELNHPHGLMAPVLMDATVEQKEGYRFLYCLPWNENRLLIEDTRYSDTPVLNAPEMRQEILAYCASKNWQVKEVFYEETGCLPLPLTLNFCQGKKTASEIFDTPLTVGMKAGLFHPTTGYSFPMAIKTVETLLKNAQASKWESCLEEFRTKIYRKQRFYIWLNRVMFKATSPQERFRFLQHFYRLPDDLISAFYANRLGWGEKIRFFFRTPPVSVSAAFSAVSRKALHDT